MRIPPAAVKCREASFPESPECGLSPSRSTCWTPRRFRHTEQRREARTDEITINEQHAEPLLCKCHREIDADRRLPLVGMRARDKDRLATAGLQRVGNMCAQLAERLGVRRPGLTRHGERDLFRLTCAPLRLCKPLCRPERATLPHIWCNSWHHCHQRDAKPLLHRSPAAQRMVEKLTRECDSSAEQQSEHHGEEPDTSHRCRKCGGALRRINHLRRAQPPPPRPPALAGIRREVRRTVPSVRPQTVTAAHPSARVPGFCFSPSWIIAICSPTDASRADRLRRMPGPPPEASAVPPATSVSSALHLSAARREPSRSGDQLGAGCFACAQFFEDSGDCRARAHRGRREQPQGPGAGRRIITFQPGTHICAESLLCQELLTPRLEAESSSPFARRRSSAVYNCRFPRNVPRRALRVTNLCVDLSKLLLDEHATAARLLLRSRFVHALVRVHE